MNDQQQIIWNQIKEAVKKMKLPDGVIDAYLHDKGTVIPSVSVYPDRGQIKICGHVYAKGAEFLTDTVFSECQPFDMATVIDAVNRAMQAVSNAAQDQTPPTEAEAFGAGMVEAILKTYDRIDAHEQFGR